MIVYFNGQVRPERNPLQRWLDRLLGRKWVLVAECGDLYWFEMR
jgi:hypothetical protein